MTIKLRWKALSNGRKSAYLDFYNDGIRKYEFLKIYIDKKDSPQDKKDKKRLAENIRAKKEILINSQSHGFIPSFQKKVDFIKYFEKYIDNYPNKDKKKLIGALNKFRLFIGKNRINIIDINPSICEGFKNYLINKSGLSGETPYGYWKQFKAVIKKAILEDIIIKNPCDNIRFKKVNGSKQLKKNILTKDEIQKIALTYCGNDDVKKAFLFACFTGLGLAEIRKLKWGAINNNKIKIYREKTGEQIINDLPSTALKIIGKPKPSKEYIFNKLPSDTSVNKTLQNWIKRANIDKKITFYCGRHTFATQLLINGANLKTVADCLGHTTTQNTVKYLNYVDSLKKGAINSLPDIDLF